MTQMTQAAALKSSEKKTSDLGKQKKTGSVQSGVSEESNTLWRSMTQHTMLPIGASDDIVERSADRFADKVVGQVTNTSVQGASRIATSQGLLVAKSEQGGLQASAGLQRELSTTQSQGSAMPAVNRTQIERGTGHPVPEVKIHSGASADRMASGMNARAFTLGNNIYFKDGHYKPGTREGAHLLAHEVGHVVHNDSGIRRDPLDNAGEQGDVSQESEQSKGKHESESHQVGGTIFRTGSVVPRPSYTVQTHKDVVLYKVAGGSREILEFNPDHYKVIPANTDVELLDSTVVDSNVEMILVRAPMTIRNRETLQDRTFGFMTSGWIRRDYTNLNTGNDPANEREKLAQDLDDMLDEVIEPTISRWKSAAEAQGMAYSKAYHEFKGTLEKAAKEREMVLEWFDLALTAVSAGALGFLGDSAKSGGKLISLLGEGGMGSLEDLVQAALAESIDIGKGHLSNSGKITSTHPDQYGAQLRREMDNLRADTFQLFGATKSKIRRSNKAVDRAQVLVEMYSRWNKTLASNLPESTGEDVPQMAIALEKVIWQKYILNKLVKVGKNRIDYQHPENAIEKQLDALGISKEAGIKEWDSFWGTVPALEKRTKKGPQGERIEVRGSSWTEKLHNWAIGYTPPRYR